MNPFVADFLSTALAIFFIILIFFAVGFWVATCEDMGSWDYEKRYKRVRIGVSVFLVILIVFVLFCWGINNRAPEANYVYFSTNSNVYHYYGCEHIKKIKQENLEYREESDFFDSNNDPFGDGTYYRGCSSCSKHTGNLAHYKEAKHEITVGLLLMGGIGGVVFLCAFIQNYRNR